MAICCFSWTLTFSAKKKSNSVRMKIPQMSSKFFQHSGGNVCTFNYLAVLFYLRWAILKKMLFKIILFVFFFGNYSISSIQIVCAHGQFLSMSLNIVHKARSTRLWVWVCVSKVVDESVSQSVYTVLFVFMTINFISTELIFVSVLIEICHKNIVRILLLQFIFDQFSYKN